MSWSLCVEYSTCGNGTLGMGALWMSTLGKLLIRLSLRLPLLRNHNLSVNREWYIWTVSEIDTIINWCLNYISFRYILYFQIIKQFVPVGMGSDYRWMPNYCNTYNSWKSAWLEYWRWELLHPITVWGFFVFLKASTAYILIKDESVRF